MLKNPPFYEASISTTFSVFIELGQRHHLIPKHSGPAPRAVTPHFSSPRPCTPGLLLLAASVDWPIPAFSRNRTVEYTASRSARSLWGSSGLQPVLAPHSFWWPRSHLVYPFICDRHLVVSTSWLIRVTPQCPLVYRFMCGHVLSTTLGVCIPYT